MKLVFFRGKVPNFGDELNTSVWQSILPPGFLDEDESDLFVGIGSIIGDHLPATSRKHVMGSGYAGYMGRPDINDGTWNIAFVRGPRTAAALGLPAEKAICDSAILLRTMDLPEAAPGIDVAFMPHYESLERGFWAEACRLAGITLIDATDPTDKILGQLRGARLLITEAMHGAIVADALRTPWIGVKPIYRGHHMKWLDWSEALSIDLRMHDLKPSNLLELYVSVTGRGGENGRSGRLNESALSLLPNKLLTYRATQHLRVLARQEPQLSTDQAIADATDRALSAVDGFVRSYSPA